jgi:hypothetical protein
VVDDIVSQLEELRDECQEKHDNMPDQLQDSGSGEILQGRADEIDSMIGELEGIDTEVCIDEDVKGGIEEDNPKEDGESDEDYKMRIEDLVQEAISDATDERKQEIVDEIQNVSYNGE